MEMKVHNNFWPFEQKVWCFFFCPKTRTRVWANMEEEE